LKALLVGTSFNALCYPAVLAQTSTSAAGSHSGECPVRMIGAANAGLPPYVLIDNRLNPTPPLLDRLRRFVLNQAPALLSVSERDGDRALEKELRH